jgi:hypothetical protein
MSAYIGLDVHKDWTFATDLDQNGRVVAQRKLENEHVPSFLEQFNVLRVGLESSTYIVPLYRALADRGFRVEVGHPKKTGYIAEARIKSDNHNEPYKLNKTQRSPTTHSRGQHTTIGGSTPLARTLLNWLKMVLIPLFRF